MRFSIIFERKDNGGEGWIQLNSLHHFGHVGEFIRHFRDSSIPRNKDWFYDFCSLVTQPKFVSYLRWEGFGKVKYERKNRPKIGI